MKLALTYGNVLVHVVYQGQQRSTARSLAVLPLLLLFCHTTSSLASFKHFLRLFFYELSFSIYPQEIIFQMILTFQMWAYKVYGNVSQILMGPWCNPSVNSPRNMPCPEQRLSVLALRTVMMGVFA